MNSARKTVLLTGASGFVGGALLKDLSERNLFNIRASTRNASSLSSPNFESVTINGLDAGQSWTQALNGVDLVVHSAARVHIMDAQGADSMALYREINVDGTLNLASQAAAHGVQRFIFISSIKVNGESTLPNHPYTADSIPAPVDDYGISKHEAEIGLKKIAAETSMEVVIIRPTLVYGPGVKANFLTMMRIIDKGLPLPFGRINNKRSMVALDNLVDFVFHCLLHPSAANQTFLISDGEDVSTPELLRRISLALGKKSVLLPVPVNSIKLLAYCLGKRSMSERLCGTLQVDITKNRQLLGWTPPVAMKDALRKTAMHFKGSIEQ
ncbi:UDP-glucose 4-epimerase family protein [Pseudomonas sp. PB3P13]